MVLLALLALGSQRPPAEGILRGVLTHYQKLKSLTVRVIHHADFMADAKDSSDALSWVAPRRFVLVSSRDSIPKLMSDGRRLTTFIPQVAPIGEPLEMEPGRTKSWEGRGGILLSFMMRGPMAEQWLHPERGIKTSFEWGKTLHWHDLEVSEIVETINARNAIEKISFYLSANHEHLLGTEVVTGSESIWTQYDGAVENPDLPATLGSLAKG